MYRRNGVAGIRELSAISTPSYESMKIKILSLVLIAISSICYCQTTYATRDSVHIFWQPNVTLTFSDYLADTTQERIKDMKEYGYTASASLGIWSILDIPKRKRDRHTKFEKIYFAPAFERTTSCALADDSVQLAIQKTLFDINELSARWARRKLYTLRDETNSTGAMSIMYLSVKDEMEAQNQKMVYSFIKQVIISKEEGSFQEWRKTIDDLLLETSKWATTAEECYRLMTGQPIDKDYIMAPTLIDMGKR